MTRAVVGVDRPSDGLVPGNLTVEPRLVHGATLVVLVVRVPCAARSCPIDEHVFELAIDSHDAAAVGQLVVEHGRLAVAYGPDGGSCGP